MISPPPLLDVRGLRTVFRARGGDVTAVDGVSFSLGRGERLGVVGESGSGKTVTALTITGLLRVPRSSVSGRVLLDGTDLLALRPKERRRVLGRRIGIVFQNPLNSLNPAMTTGEQIAEAVRAHLPVSRAEAWDRAVDLLGKVGIPAPPRSARDYPHRFSGGMRQRVMIAIALACDPDLVFADEPTTALDVTTQAQIVDLLFALSEERGMSVVFITHDLALLAGFADRILVMQRGRVVEEGPVDRIYDAPSHPYTRALMAAVGRLTAGAG